MKIRNPKLIRAFALVAAWVIRFWIGTLRHRYRPLGPNFDPHQLGSNPARYIYAFWHENMLLLAYHYARPDVYVLVSQHADGELISGVCRHLGFRIVRGSTTRRGAAALHQMVHLSQDAHLAITPDGPRGPRRTLQVGAVYLAARTGLPIVPVGVGFRRAWRMRSWDRFTIPKPWARVVMVYGAPIRVERSADEATLTRLTDAVRDALIAAEQHGFDLLGEERDW